MTKKEKFVDFFSTLKNKIIDLRFNKTFLVCCLLSVIYLISGYWKWLEILVSVCAIIFMAILPIQNALCIFIFLHSFTLSNIGYDSCFMVTLIGFTLILLVKYILGVKKGRYLYHKKLVIAISTFYIITTALSLFKSLYNGAWLYFTYLPLIYLIFEMRKDVSISQGMNYMFGGMITGCMLSLTSILFPSFQYDCFGGDRFRAFINNTNYLYMRALFVLSYYIYRYLSKDLSNIKFCSIYLLCSAISLATLSKTGICMLALLTLIFVILFLKQDFKKNIKTVGIFALLLIIVAVICYKFIFSIFERFLNAFNSGDLINSLLTGRDLIWSIYLDEIFKNPLNFLIGHGLLTEQIYIASIFGPTETHNFYIFLLYRFGIVGTIALGYIVYLFIKELNPTKPKFIAYLPLIYILIESLFDNTMKCYNITYFLFAFMILFMNCKSKNEECSQNQPEQIEEKTEN